MPLSVTPAASCANKGTSVIIIPERTAKVRKVSKQAKRNVGSHISCRNTWYIETGCVGAADASDEERGNSPIQRKHIMVTANDKTVIAQKGAYKLSKKLAATPPTPGPKDTSSSNMLC
jgi:hypothetical protein